MTGDYLYGWSLVGWRVLEGEEGSSSCSGPGLMGQSDHLCGGAEGQYEVVFERERERCGGMLMLQCRFRR